MHRLDTMNSCGPQGKPPEPAKGGGEPSFPYSPGERVGSGSLSAQSEPPAKKEKGFTISIKIPTKPK